MICSLGVEKFSKIFFVIILKINIKNVFIHIKNTGIIPNLIKLTDYIDVNDARKMEYYFVKKFTDEGLNILNKVKTGGIGGQDTKWTKEKCIEEALKYNSYKDFKKGCRGAYIKCISEKWLDILTHLKKNNSWIKENCIEEALKYNNRKDYQNYSGSSYMAALRNKWLDDICTHMSDYRLPNGYWTKEKCKEEAIKYKNRSSYSKNSNVSYLIASRNSWIDEICSHMK